MSDEVTHDYLLGNDFFDLTNTLLESSGEISTLKKQKKNKKAKQKKEETISHIKSQLNGFSPHFNDIIINRIKLQLESGNGNISDIAKEILDEIFWDEKQAGMRFQIPIEEFYPKPKKIKTFPENTWLLHIKFTLKKPYTSKDESEFRCSNNPILRDKLLGCPIVAPSTWKGNLRFAARQVDGDNEHKISRIFGPESNIDEDARKGRVYFYPTFFTGQTVKDVITPLSRKTRTPTSGPIDMEVVPTNTSGDFYMLYFPYPKGENWKAEEVFEDLNFIMEALEKMFLQYGFSAKKTSGFGVIHDKVEDFNLIWDENNKGRNRRFKEVNFDILKDEIEKIKPKKGGKK